MHVHICIFWYNWIYTYVHICKYVYIYVYIYIHVCLHVYIYAYVYTCTCIYIHTLYIYIYIYIHKNAHKLFCVGLVDPVVHRDCRIICIFIYIYVFISTCKDITMRTNLLCIGPVELGVHRDCRIACGAAGGWVCRVHVGCVVASGRRVRWLKVNRGNDGERNTLWWLECAVSCSMMNLSASTPAHYTLNKGWSRIHMNKQSQTPCSLQYLFCVLSKFLTSVSQEFATVVFCSNIYISFVSHCVISRIGPAKGSFKTTFLMKVYIFRWWGIHM